MSETSQSDAVQAAQPAGQLSVGDTRPVIYEMDGQVAHLIMQHRPHNFLDPALMEGLVEGVRWAQEQGARAVVLRSSLRHFCAGADVSLFEGTQDGASPEQDLTEVLRAVEESPLPIVASVHGVCVGGGLETALACDLVIATESSKIGSVEATIGMNPLMGAMQRVAQRAGAARAKEMALLARRYDARTLERWNVINRVVPDEQLVDATNVIAQELAHGPTVAHASTKRIISVAVNEGVRAADEAMHELQKDIWSSNDLKEGLRSLVTNGPGAARFGGN
ncbi:enoyl-CoA hydratase/isomerase family protein [Saccharopolyspora mangrovi]|uniref:Enoyl-CoA hydratase/isomerase family protein n=1 Tax=Saccharopolyspora mangrovi TaxID=3082379 RepID=A0ABU6AJ80_9PSEU|nr:enoyl-CoA hydratase/isomerase family protein [Saccharopolyspora sp. S2-29]MEB3371370.1 enoyl-CoA hydratase/isomerase family protein [Saccharopolyspora sp. S2-29]